MDGTHLPHSIGWGNDMLFLLKGISYNGVPFNGYVNALNCGEGLKISDTSPLDCETYLSNTRRTGGNIH